ncbi:uncharacterized protein LOC128955270 [Oppia nitens]|uniref:uncharacterized protein LOC128955270 n=1 Tax=Oppia nitens TaxID=1686743 RepID=UPI0023DAED9E|nr:uncharacterized protein LOC128955270 [Oppia nitens]
MPQLAKQSIESLNSITIETIQLESLGRIAELGEFYDKRYDKFTGINIFKRKLLSDDHVASIENKYTNLKFGFEQCISDKFHQWDLGAELQLSVLGGYFEFNGAAEYFKSRKSSARSTRLTMVETINTRYESINLADKTLSPAINWDALSEIQFTHIVVGIQWGGKVIVQIDDSNDQNEDIVSIEGRLGANINLLFNKISGEVSINNTDIDWQQLGKYKFEVFGDILPDYSPVSIEDALVFMRNTPKLLVNGNDGKGKQMTHILMPINTFRQLWQLDGSNDSTIVVNIDPQVIDKCVKLFDDMNSIEQKLNDYYISINRFRDNLKAEHLDYVSQLKANYSKYQEQVSHVLHNMLIDVRSGIVGVEKLEETLFTFINDEYSMDNMFAKLNNLEKLQFKLSIFDRVKSIKNIHIINKYTNFANYYVANYNKIVIMLMYSYDVDIHYDNLETINILDNMIRRLPQNLTNDYAYYAINYEIIDNKMQQLFNISKYNITTKQTTIAFYRKGRLINQTIPEIGDPIIYILGGALGNKMLAYNIRLKDFRGVKPFAYKVDKHKMIAFNNFIYLIGGRIGDTTSHIVERYDQINDNWHRMASLNIQRYSMGAAVMDNKIYVCGGYKSKDNKLYSCEYYDYIINEWIFTTPMINLRTNFQLISHFDSLYAIGGEISGKTNSVDRYSVVSKKWTPITSMNQARTGHSAAAMMGQIYVCGGNDLKTCEMYNPDKDIWKTIESMNEKRYLFNLISYNNILYAIGGRDNDGWFAKNFESIEIFDNTTGKWFYSNTMPEKIYDFEASLLVY